MKGFSKPAEPLPLRMLLNSADYCTLRVLFESTAGRSWKSIEGWDDDNSVAWHGIVTVLGDRRRSEASKTPKLAVGRISLEDNGLDGALPADLASSLRRLLLSRYPKRSVWPPKKSSICP